MNINQGKESVEDERLPGEGARSQGRKGREKERWMKIGKLIVCGEKHQ